MNIAGIVRSVAAFRFVLVGMRDARRGFVVIKSRKIVVLSQGKNLLFLFISGNVVFFTCSAAWEVVPKAAEKMYKF